MKAEVVLVGPVPPWRSGIADQTVRLARALRSRGVPPVVFTFRRMYPSLLYPGERDRDAGPFPEDLDVRPILDGANPLTFRQAARDAAALAPRLVVVPWWTAWWGPHVLVLLSTLQSRSRAVKLLLCHNVFDHERGALRQGMAREVFRRADRFAVQNRRAVEILSGELPGRPVELLVHPSEPVEVLPDRDRARGRLGIAPERPVFLFTGILRPYKGWDVLLRAFEDVRRAIPDALLVLAGEAWGDAKRLPKRALSGVRLELRYLSVDERRLWLEACDAVVCPYRHATGSGVAADAFAHGRPVIGTAVDGLVEVVEDGENGLLVPPEDAPALARAMTRFVVEGLGPRLSAGAVASRGRFSPDAHAHRLLVLGGIES